MFAGTDMETTSCLKAVVSAATLYRNNPADPQVVQLQRQLDVRVKPSQFTKIIVNYPFCHPNAQNW